LLNTSNVKCQPNFSKNHRLDRNAPNPALTFTIGTMSLPPIDISLVWNWNYIHASVNLEPLQKNYSTLTFTQTFCKLGMGLRETTQDQSELSHPLPNEKASIKIEISMVFGTLTSRRHAQITVLLVQMGSNKLFLTNCCCARDHGYCAFPC